MEAFVDSDELPPQIVGHTSRSGPDRKGRSWCLDGEQTCYGILDGNELEVRFADESGPKTPEERHIKKR
ncbi:MAG: hypothetical protein JJT96_15000 [Opitutales bacterium]|nr:hypothetical protein [Opitutales bacterium]